MRKLSLFLLLVLTFAVSSRTLWADTQGEYSAAIRSALDHLRDTEALTIEEQITICQIPAPSFKEQERGEYLRRRFTEVGLKNVRVDAVGNVIGERAGTTREPALVVAAHLDTVFPEGTDVTVKRVGSVLKGPGIGDDSRGLTLLLALNRALNFAGLKTDRTIIFVGTVGEEGLGNLRGVRHLFSTELKGKVGYFISLDGTDLRIVNVAVGSRRYRVTYSGTGGHSYSDFGIANPIHALGRAIDKVARFKVPAKPKTTFSIGVVRGGTSVNSISQSATMEVDLRSESGTELNKLSDNFSQVVQSALEEENLFWQNKQRLTVDIQMVGERPAGAQSPGSPIVRAVLAADAALGISSKLIASSTDANYPMSIGIPSLTLGGGGSGLHAHSVNEEFDTSESYLGAQRALLTILEIAGKQ